MKKALGEYYHSAVRPNPVAIGTVVWLGSELMFFAGFFAIFFSLRGAALGVWAADSSKLDRLYALVNTVILILSSVTCQFAVRASERFQPRRRSWQPRDWGAIEWFYLSAFLGLIFLAGQVNEYASLYAEGITLKSSAFGSVFYLTTGFHGLHVLGGIAAMLVLIGRFYAVKRFSIHDAVAAIAVSYYWHFVDIVWVFLFSSIYILGV